MTLLEDIVNVPDGAYPVPDPFAAVYHPVKVNPARVGCVAEMVNVAPVLAVALPGAPDPPFAL